MKIRNVTFLIVSIHSTVFHSYHGHSSHYSCLSWVSPVLGWGSKVSCPWTFPRKNQRIQCGSNPGTLDYASNTLSESHAGPLSAGSTMLRYGQIF